MISEIGPVFGFLEDLSHDISLINNIASPEGKLY
jgi:hypothetical protein